MALQKNTTWINFSWQDEPWAEFSTLQVAACSAMHLLCRIAIRPNLELKTPPKQLFGSLPLDIALPAECFKMLAIVGLLKHLLITEI